MNTSEDKDYKNYLFYYNFDGGRWTFEIKATSPDEAEERVKRIAFAEYQGEIEGEPIYIGEHGHKWAKPFMDLYLFLLNKFRR